MIRPIEKQLGHGRRTFLEGCVDLAPEQFRRLHHQGYAAMPVPIILRFPQPPVAVVHFLDQPGQPAHAGFGDDDLQLRMPLQYSPGKEIDEGIDELGDEALGMG